jgi:hypothetical protein
MGAGQGRADAPALAGPAPGSVSIAAVAAVAARVSVAAVAAVAARVSVAVAAALALALAGVRVVTALPGAALAGPALRVAALPALPVAALGLSLAGALAAAAAACLCVREGGKQEAGRRGRRQETKKGGESVCMSCHGSARAVGSFDSGFRDRPQPCASGRSFSQHVAGRSPEAGK